MRMHKTQQGRIDYPMVGIFLISAFFLSFLLYPTIQERQQNTVIEANTAPDEKCKLVIPTGEEVKNDTNVVPRGAILTGDCKETNIPAGTVLSGTSKPGEQK